MIGGADIELVNPQIGLDAKNYAVIFIPNENTCHGVGRRPKHGLRKFEILNEVTLDVRHTWELT